MRRYHACDGAFRYAPFKGYDDVQSPQQRNRV